MDKPFNHLIICLTFVMPVAALSGCSGPNDSPEQDAVMSISSCTARGDDGQEMSVSEFGMFVTDTAGNLYPDNIRVLNRSGKWTFAEYNPQIQISAESETKRSIFREKDKTKRSKKESAQHSKSRNKSFVMTSVSAL